MPPYRQRFVNTGPVDLTDADISFSLARLFDTQNMDHIPEKERMEQFEHRDLAHIKHYKAAVKIFGGPLSRKRVIIAPPMENTTKHRLGLYLDKKSPPPAPVLNTALIPQIPPEKPLPEEIAIAREAQDREDKYKQWFKERQTFRNNLENMGLSMGWLENKPNKTVQEKRVLNRLKEEALGKKLEEEKLKQIEETPEPVTRSQSADSDESPLPQMNIPAPLGLVILEKHLKDNKLRLIDLFTDVDKNKDWKISREDFVKSCEKKNIPISKGVLEDMLIALDMNLVEEVDYKEMARGLELTRKQRIEDRRKDLSRESSALSRLSGSRKDSGDAKYKDIPIIQSPMKKDGSQRSTPQKGIISPIGGKTGTKPQDTSLHSTSSSKSGKFVDHSSQKSVVINDQVSVLTESSPIKSSKTNTKSTATGDKQTGNQGISRERTGTPNHLEPPHKDVREERLILKSEEAMVDLRKRDREALKGYNANLEAIPGTIKTGNKSIDDHCMRSTMVGDIGNMVDQFRQKRLQEYYDIVKLCKDNEVILSPKLLEKVLLYPPDLPHSELKKLRHPDSAPLISSHFADPPKRPRTPIEVKHKDKVRRSKSGKLLIDSRHKYPVMKTVAAEGYKQNLSTGRAVIRRKVDCWMTFEEYEKLTKHFAVRYQNLHGSAHKNAFWPGHLLDKIRLCMPPYDKQGIRDKEVAIFRRVQRTSAVNYGYEPTDVWRMNDNLYTQIGIHDHFRNKTII